MLQRSGSLRLRSHGKDMKLEPIIPFGGPLWQEGLELSYAPRLPRLWFS